MFDRPVLARYNVRLRLRWSKPIMRHFVVALVVFSIVLNGSAAAQEPTPTAVTAVIAVERAVVFPEPDRAAAPLTYLFERERVPVLAQTADGVFLLVPVDGQRGWMLRAQADIEGDLALVPLANALTPLPPTPTLTPFVVATATPGAFPTRTPLPTATPAPEAAFPPDATPAETLEADLPFLPGIEPPLTIDLPQDWQAAHFVVPFRAFDGQVDEVALSVYGGPLPGEAVGIIYVYWGFRNTVDWITGEYNLYADGAQILRGSLVGESCNLGIYEERVFPVGGLQGVGAFYQAANCETEKDTSGWFTTVRVYDGAFAFFVAVEPWNARSDQRGNLQAILDSVEFLPLEAE
jgi:hypothetical protein